MSARRSRRQPTELAGAIDGRSAHGRSARRISVAGKGLSSPHCGHPWVLITYDRMFCLASKEKVLCKPWYLHHYIGRPRARHCTFTKCFVALQLRRRLPTSDDSAQKVRMRDGDVGDHSNNFSLHVRCTPSSCGRPDGCSGHMRVPIFLVDS